MSNAVMRNYELGQATWLDYLRRGLLTSGEFAGLIRQGVSGVTSNPTIFEKAITGSNDYDEELLELARAGSDPMTIYERLAIDDVGQAADALSDWYERSGGADGFASIEVSPLLAHDTEASVVEARRFFDALSRPNIMIKIPGTREGIPAIRRLTAEGVNVNVTLIFSLRLYDEIRAAYLAGLREFMEAGGDPAGVHSVASFFLSRVDTAVDTLLQGRIAGGEADLKELLGQAALANAKIAYRDFTRTFSEDEFAAMEARGAHRQRPLWASTGTKNPLYGDIMYVQPLIGPDTINTMTQATFVAWLDHGEPRLSVEEGVSEAEEHLARLAGAGIHMDEVTDALLDDGIRLFTESLARVLANIEEKVERLLRPTRVIAGVNLGNAASQVSETLDRMTRTEFVGRIWRKDYHLWSEEPVRVTDRLGWLTVTEMMSEQLGALGSFADEVRNAGYQDAVLCGMGGSTLGPEVLRQVFGKEEISPRLTVLDSTVPETVRRVAGDIDTARTLFLIASKSGTTLETTSLYRYFYARVEDALGEGAGANFAAITDPGTVLQEEGQRRRFRRVFLNPPDIGGRYSVLSYFGLVPAALLGMDLFSLLDRADRMREACASCVPLGQNPGAWLGAVMATMAQAGRDKLTLVISPMLESFGSWVEQLIAESTGKHGRGILPVVGEPRMEAGEYGPDRLFVYLRMENDETAELDAFCDDLKSHGHPVVGLEMREPYELGSEFFRWEFATAVAGALLEINAFDEPNVLEAKNATEAVLDLADKSGDIPAWPHTPSLEELLDTAHTSDYVGILVYAEASGTLDAALQKLRESIAARYGLATTVGYGPRYLHSTGQLHKGGPEKGIFLMVTTDHGADLPVPCNSFSFNRLLQAQARGDYQALRTNKRPIAHIHIEEDAAGSLASLATGITENAGKRG